MSMLQVSSTILQALSGPTLCRINILFEEYGLRKDVPLESLAKLQDIIDQFDLKMDPPIGVGGLEAERVIKRYTNNDFLSAKIKEILNQGEGQRIEFKSSIFIDTKKKEYNPGLDVGQCVDQRLKQKLSREMAAFLNSDGGVILLGVSDEGGLRGCDDDFSTFPAGGSTSDKADLIVKQIIDQNFLEPESVFDRVSVECARLDGKSIVILDILPKKRLSFLKEPEPSRLYIRMGSHAVPIPYEKIEEYFELRRI